MRKNFGLKITAVVLSFAIWFFIMSRGQSEVSLEAPVEFVNVPQTLEVVDPESLPHIAIGVRGHERFLRNLSTEDVHIYIDMKSARAGRRSYGIGEEDVKLPVPLKLINIYPTSVRVRVRSLTESQPEGQNK